MPLIAESARRAVLGQARNELKQAAGNNVRVAIVMASLGVDRAAAEKRLEETGGHLWKALRPAGDV